ncbi:MAG: T9SS type A sorting domain-containing protein, partial [Bacteroidales bacterium]|nr:T9SS type A sorting domain-containing protein [Bacteroidales bacterium]
AYTLALHPNPVSGDDAVLAFTTAKAEELTVTIYSLSGIRMGETLRLQAQAGQQRILLPTASLRAGFYMVVVNGEDGRRAACKLLVR